MQQKISDRLRFETEDAALILKKDGKTVHSVDLIRENIASEAREHFRQKLLENEGSFRGTVEDAAEEAKHVMDITRFHFGINITIEQAAEASENLSRSMP